MTVGVGWRLALFGLPSLPPTANTEHMDLLSGAPAATFDHEVTLRLEAMAQDGRSEDRGSSFQGYFGAATSARVTCATRLFHERETKS